MQNLEFCQQCEVYHNLTLVQGKKVFTECERTILQDLPTQVAQPDRIPQQDLFMTNIRQSSPTSKGSYISINNHIQPSIINQSAINMEKLPSKIQLQKTQSVFQIQKNVIPTPQKQILPPNTIQIVIRNPASRQLPKKQPTKMIHLKPMPPPIIQRKDKPMLSTIVEEKYEGTQRSWVSSKAGSYMVSPRLSFDDRMLAQTGTDSLAQKFKSARQGIDEVRSPKSIYVFKNINKKYQINGSHLEEQKVCWCW